MGWLKSRLGETNTAMGMGILYFALRSAFPAYGVVIDAVAGVVGVAHVVTPER